MRTLRELETDTELDPMIDGGDDLSNQPLNDPDD
jgi:hypothetical protein